MKSVTNSLFFETKSISLVFLCKFHWSQWCLVHCTYCCSSSVSLDMMILVMMICLCPCLLCRIPFGHCFMAYFHHRIEPAPSQSIDSFTLSRMVAGSNSMVLVLKTLSHGPKDLGLSKIFWIGLNCIRTLYILSRENKLVKEYLCLV